MTSSRIIAYVMVVVALAAIVGSLGFSATAQQHQSRQAKCYNTVTDLARALDLLDQKTFSDAKVVVAPSSRNYLGLAGDPYCLIY